MKVLIAEDDAISRRLLEARLVKWGYQVVAASDGSEAWEELQHADAPQLTILDWMMPGMDGLQLCRRIREKGGEPYTYILLLTAKDGTSNVIEGLEAGADDYLTKPFDSLELEARLRAGKRILELQSELIGTREALRDQATRDSLTGLWNHVAILEILDRELARSRREGTIISISMADLDHFKRVNDTYGHRAGDLVLREVTRRFESTVRTYDHVGRYGGEEFLIVLPGCDLASGEKQAERLRLSVGQTAVNIPDASMMVTVSLGVAASNLVPDPSAEDLLHAADVALYRAKNAGRNRVAVAARGDFAAGRTMDRA